MSEVKGQAPMMHQKDLIIEKCEEIKFVENIDDDYLGKLQLHRLHPYVKYIASKSIPIQYIQNFQKRIQMKHPNIFFYIKKAHVNQKTSGSTFNIFFEYNYFSLEQMISKRKENGWHYPEIELWTLLKEVTSGLKFLMDQNIHHGELNKSSIFFDDEYLLYRVYDNYLVNGDKYYQYQRNNQSLLIDTGTPPPEFSSYDFIQFKNTYKLDVWNFGLILLECATLQNVKDLLYFNNTLKTDQLNLFLQSLNGKYSAAFINILLKMLDPDPRSRLDWGQIQKVIQTEPLANQSPPYQVEPTQLHPSRCLNNLHEIVVGAQPASAQKENVDQDSQNGNKNKSPQKQAIGDQQIYNGQNVQKQNGSSQNGVLPQANQIQNAGYQQYNLSANSFDTRTDYENISHKFDALSIKSQLSAQQLSSSNLSSQPLKGKTASEQKNSNNTNGTSAGMTQDLEREKNLNDLILENKEYSNEYRDNILKAINFKSKDTENNTLQAHPTNSATQSQQSATTSASSGPTLNQAFNQRLMLLNKKIQDTLMQSQKQTKKLTQNGPR